MPMPNRTENTRTLGASRDSQRFSFHSYLILTILFAVIGGFTFIWTIHSGVISNYSNVNEKHGGIRKGFGWMPESSGENANRGNDVGEVVSFQDEHEWVNNVDDDELDDDTVEESRLIRAVEDREDPSISPTKPKTSQNRLYCMVPFIWTPTYLHSYHAIRATWGKRCHILKFFIDPVIGDDNVGYYNMSLASDVVAAAQTNEDSLKLPKDVVILHEMRRPWHTCKPEENVKSNKPIGNCRNIWEKIWRSWVYIAFGVGGSTVGLVNDGVPDVYKAEWFVKVDADTYLFPDNLSRFVVSQNWSYEDHHYFGHVLNHRVSDRGVSIVAGAAVFLSRATVLAGAESFQSMPMDKGDEEEDGTCRDAYTGTEEVVTAVCLKEHANVTAVPALDSAGREQVCLYDIGDINRYNRTEQGEWWYWEGKKRYPCHDEGDCLSYLPLAFHDYKDSSYFYDFEKEFYGSLVTGEEDKSLIERYGKKAARHWGDFTPTYKYFEKVRAAMKRATLEEAAAETISLEQKSRQLATSVNRSPDTSQQLATADGRDRLYCMVPFIWTPRYLPSYHAIHKTWGKRCDILRFMIDPIIGDNETGYKDLRETTTTVDLPKDVVVIHNMQRPWHQCPSYLMLDGNCRNIWEKIWRSWVWVDSNGHSDQAEWFVKVDADTFLFPENVKRYVHHMDWSPEEHHYFGHMLKHTIDSAVPIIAGAAAFFSRATLKGAAEIFRQFSDGNGSSSQPRFLKCRDEHSEQEEVITAVCLKEHLNIDAVAALDDMGNELVTVGEIEDVLLWNRTEQGEWWYWKNKPKVHPETGGEIHQCCGDLPIAFHGYKDAQWLFKLENEFYQTDENSLSAGDESWKKYEWRNRDKTKEYFDRVRKAMQG